MPIEFSCPHCDSLLRVEDTNAGKRARCPHCGAINRIPGELADPAPAPPVSHQFFIDSVSGQTYGPITKPELDQWVSEGRISASCLIRATGQATGQPAPVYYPSLADQAPLEKFDPVSDPVKITPISSPIKQASQNPYVAPTPTTQGVLETISVESITPVRIDLGQVFTLAYQLFVSNMALLVMVAVVCLIPAVLNNIIQWVADDGQGNMDPIAWMLVLVLNLIQIYLAIGQTRIALRIVRRQPVELTELFNGGDKFLSILGLSFLVAIPMLCGFAMLIVPGVFLILFFWPCYSLIIDYKTGVFDSFGIAYRIGEINLLNSFVLGLAAFGIACLGAMMCGIGYVFASGYISVLWAAAYLMMSGQVRIRSNQ